jgi:PAS domain S-box-containing protein
MDRPELEQWKPKEVARLLALVETERRYYQEIVGNLPVALLVVGAEGTIISSNRAFRKLSGWTGADLLRRRVEDVLALPELTERIQGVLAGGDGQELTLDAVPFKSGARPMQVNIQPMQGWEEDGGREAIVLFSAPAMMEAPAPQILVRDVSSELDAVVFEFDPAESRLVSISAKAVELLGWAEEELLGPAETWGRRIHVDDLDTVIESFRRAAESGEPQSYEYRALTRDGRVLWLRESLRPVVTGTGEVAKIRGLALDVSERHHAQQLAAQTEKVDALGRLAGRVAHDFNNLLMIIAGYGEEIKNALPASHPLYSDLQEILQASERVYALTNQLQNYTRRVPLHPADVETEGWLRGLEPRLQSLAGDGIRIRLELPAAPGSMRADAAQLGQVLETLALHARFSLRGTGTLTISAADADLGADYAQHPGLRPGEYVIVTVADDGPGFDAEARQRLFEPWTAADESEREQRMALAGAYNVIRQLGGDLAVASELGRGTTFRIYLPRVARAVQPAPAAVPPPAPAPEPPPPAEPETALETILVVEDEAGIRALVRKILKRQGYNVLEAAGGEEALALCAQHRGGIDLLITDVMMPQMTGRELADRLRALRSELRVLYVSGYTDDAMIQSGSFPAGTGFLQKPFTLGSLLGKVREVLDQPGAMGQASAR